MPQALKTFISLFKSVGLSADIISRSLTGSQSWLERNKMVQQVSVLIQIFLPGAKLPWPSWKHRGSGLNNRYFNHCSMSLFNCLLILPWRMTKKYVSNSFTYFLKFTLWAYKKGFPTINVKENLLWSLKKRLKKWFYSLSWRTLCELTASTLKCGTHSNQASLAKRQMNKYWPLKASNTHNS